MKNFKKAKGITLVALIITIVVLLILAVVAIGAVTDSNIIAHAQNAESSYTIGQEKEQIGLALSEWNIEKVIPGNNPVFKTVIENALQGKIQPIQGNNDGPLTVTFIKTGNVYTVTKDGKIEGTVPPPTSEEDSITLSPTLLEIAVEEKATITATLKGSLKAEDIVWSISPEGVATIEESEDNLTVKITGVSEGRTATIKAKCGEKEVTCEVKVTKSQPIVQTLRAFDMTRVINQGMNITAILPPDESEFAFYMEGVPIPATMATEVDISNLETSYSLNIEIPDNIKYKKAMFSEVVPYIFLISEDGQKVYYAMPSGEGYDQYVFSEGAFVEVSTSIDATQYYHEQPIEGVYCFGAGDAMSGGAAFVIKVGAEGAFQRITFWQNGGVILGSSEYSPITLTDNPDDFNIVLDGQPYTIRKGAKKIISNNRSMYIQDNILIFGSFSHGITPDCNLSTDEGTQPVRRFYHTSILESE